MRLSPVKVVRYSRQSAEGIGAVLWYQGYSPLGQRDVRPGAEWRGRGGLGFALGHRRRGGLGLPRCRVRLQHSLLVRDLSNQYAATLNRLFELQKAWCFPAELVFDHPVQPFVFLPGLIQVFKECLVKRRECGLDSLVKLLTRNLAVGHRRCQGRLVSTPQVVHRPGFLPAPPGIVLPISGLRQRDVSDRRQEFLVQPGQRRYARFQILIVDYWVERWPESFLQLSEQLEAVTQPREAMLFDQRFDQPDGDLQILALGSEGFGGKRYDS